MPCTTRRLRRRQPSRDYFSVQVQEPLSAQVICWRNLMKNIAVAGTGYVGLVTGTCFANLGNKVTCIDISEEKIDMLKQGEVPIYEPGLSELIGSNVKAGRLHFTTSYAEALPDADFVFICVGTPSGVDGEADLRYVRMAAESIA